MKTSRLLILTLLLPILISCAGKRVYTLAPIKTFDPDNRDIPYPREKEENQIWDLADYTFFYQVEKLLNLNWTGRKLGRALQLVDGRPADNVNALDEVPNSSWYTNRHYHFPMSIAALKRGPNVTDGPDQSGDWTIVRGKFEGGTPGFTVKDSAGDYYIIKFDAPGFQEMGSSAEAISTKILYACGYNVPQNTVVYFNPDILKIGETAQVVEGGVKRQMNYDDLTAMLKDIPRNSEGRIRVLASKYVDGKPVGIWNFRGTRNDDPNDRVHHEHRRELRGLKAISSWLNDADRRAANTLAVYTTDEETDNKYIKHYIIDMGSTLGSNNIIPHAPKYGNEYLVDPRSIALQYITFGAWVKPWEFDTRHLDPQYPSVGYFESEIFDPGDWYPTYPNPAFEYATYRDIFWGVRLVMAFSDEQIRAIVSQAKMSDPEAEEYLIRTLIERRDKIGRYWFERINPLDKFQIVNRSDAISLIFTDLAVNITPESGSDTVYLCELKHRNRNLFTGKSTEAEIGLSDVLEDYLRTHKFADERDKIFELRLETRRGSKPIGKHISVFFYYTNPPESTRIVGIDREE